MLKGTVAKMMGTKPKPMMSTRIWSPSASRRRRTRERFSCLSDLPFGATLAHTVCDVTSRGHGPEAMRYMSCSPGLTI